MKTGLLDSLFPGLTNLVYMSTAIFTEENLPNLDYHNSELINDCREVKEAKTKIHQIIKEIYNRELDKIIEITTSNHKIHKYFYRIKDKNGLRELIVKHFLKKKPIFKKYIKQNKLPNKLILNIRKNLIGDKSFNSIYTKNGINLRFYIWFESNFNEKSYNNKQYFNIGLVWENKVVISNRWVLKFKSD